MSPSLWWRIKRYRAFYLFVSPFFVLFAVFWVYPLAHSFYLSLSDWTGLGAIKFVGLRNYRLLIHDESFRQALGNTLLFAGVAVPLQVGLGLSVAGLLNIKDLRLINLFRTAYFMPFVLAPVIVGIMFLLLLDSTYGIINYVLQQLGFGRIPWLIHPFWMRVSIIMLSTWRWVGWTAVIFLAALQNIPQELIESAKIDGANDVQTFYRITVPLLRPVILFCVVILTIATLQIFAEPFALSQNQKGPGNSAYTIVYAIWNNAFNFGKFGYGAAMSYVLFALTFVFSLIQVRVGRRESYYD